MRRVMDVFLERETELRAIDDVLASPISAAAAVAVISGPAGIGKTRLLDALTARAAIDGRYIVLRARAVELETDLAWGVVRQLFAPVVREPVDRTPGGVFAGVAALALGVLGLDRRGTGGAGELSARLHGLYWLTANLAERQPLVLAVDDAHWADPASGRFIDYIAHRLSDLPVILAVTVRSGDAGARERLSVLRARPEAVVLEPPPLTVGGSARLLAAVMGRGPEPGFAAACHATTGGNPYLLRELAAQLARDRIPPLDSQASHVRAVTPQSVSHSVLLRLARLPRDARRLAEAVAVLGGSAPLAQAAQLAELDEARAATIADSLAAANVLTANTPLEFVHPLVRSAVYGEIPAMARATAHATAARQLAATGGDLDAIAAQLLQTRPAGDAWVVDTLIAAAHSARDRGAPEEAIHFLRRALDEPPEPQRRSAVLLQLGIAEAATGAPGAVAHLERAHDLADDPIERARTAIVLSSAMSFSHRTVESIQVVERALAELGGADRDLELQLQAAGFTVVWQDKRASGRSPRVPAQFDAKLAGETLGERSLLAALAAELVFSGRQSASVAAELIEHAMANGGLLAKAGVDSGTFWQAIYLAQVADALDVAAGWVRDASERARREGSVSALAIAAAYDAHESLLRGWLPDAAARADYAWELHKRAIGAWPRGPLLYIRMETWLERGQLDEAEAAAALLDRLDEPPTYTPRLFPFCSRGLLRIMEGRFKDALTDLSYVRDFAPTSNPVVLPWRARAATALTALGRRDEAREVLDEDARLARAFGTPRAVGRSLRATGLFTGGDQGVEQLSESVAVLRDCSSGLELAHSLVELGSALRRRGSRRDSLGPLRDGLDLAERSGAMRLAKRARRELTDAGARPHRPARYGRDQLTPSELRVAQMAADGATNKQIAQTLFVSLRTVETHLTHAYGKLGVATRKQLAAGLATRFPEPAEASLSRNSSNGAVQSPAQAARVS